MYPNILKKHDVYTFEYPQAIEFCEMQEDIFWTAKEISLEKDLNDIHNTLTPEELHGVLTVLKLFTEYELRVGSDYWLGRFMKVFKRPEFQRLGALLGSTELNTHAPFYAKINELLGLDTEEFYKSYTKDPTLSARMETIDAAVGQGLTDVESILRSLGSFSIVEGAILYSNFAYLKHFQAEGKNKLMNLVAGINFSVRDENIHSLAGAWVFRTTLKECLKDGIISNTKSLEGYFQDFVKQVYEHENIIISKIFEKGPIKGITDTQLCNFVKSRLDLCLSNLGFDPIFNLTYDPVSKWFYKNIQQSQLHDFFQKQGNNYNRDWREGNFNWDVSEGI